ncbi:MAG: hypothetical protein GQ540_07385 [Lutibacter sp.]|uniref:hypothetical protein n=1 Tax=Lutibacter sp. TaxID=1925666 RepID=UPI0019F1BBEA|nr:hypothetical protein [Lutibacter sp.]NOR28334.1 hypothetical protein [Lutibacter sp.]
MKKIIFIALFFVTIVVVAQEKENNNGILLGAHIPEQAEGIPSNAKSMFVNKLGQIITKNGISDDVNNSRFILVPNVTVLTKNITATAPPKVALNLEVTLYIGDGVAGNLFASESFQLKGVGNNETKAYMSALNRLSPGNSNVQKFISKGKQKIVTYYNENCTLLLKKSASLEAQSKFEEALEVLTKIPEVSTCFNKAKGKVKSLYKKVIDRDCKLKLNEASSIWAANQDIDAANEAGEILASIEPTSACFGQVKSLYSKISARVKELSDRSWRYKLKVLDLKKSEIKAARDIGVAYGNNQPNNVTYNTRGWF